MSPKTHLKNSGNKTLVYQCIPFTFFYSFFSSNCIYVIGDMGNKYFLYRIYCCRISLYLILPAMFNRIYFNWYGLGMKGNINIIIANLLCMCVCVCVNNAFHMISIFLFACCIMAIMHAESKPTPIVYTQILTLNTCDTVEPRYKEVTYNKTLL